MKSDFLLDTTVLIDHLHGLSRATAWLSGIREGQAVISVITRAEVMCGGAGEEALAAVELCDRFECLPLTREDAGLAAELRRDHRWRLPDAFQAALARRHGLKLATRNTKDFDPRKHPFVLVPY